MAIYISEFTSINGTDYKVEINTKKGNGTINFLLGGTPFVTSMDSDGKTIYAPIKTTGATITMLTKSTPFNLYTGNVMGNKVTLTNTTDNRIEWVGYVTPCAYDMGFDNEFEELEIECVDGISVLKDVPFRTDKKDVNTFLNIIFKCLKRAKVYKYLYITDNVQMTANGTENILNKIRVSESNFFEEKDYEAQIDDAVAWNCYDVLFELMQYMGYTLTTDGNNVYIMDYDAIVKGKNTYWKYDISGSSIGSGARVTLSQSHHITGESYAENGTKISLDEVYNKVTVQDEFYKIEDLIDGVDNNKNYKNITATYDTELKNWFRNDSRFLESEVFTVKNGAEEDESFFITLNKNDSGDIFFVLGKFFENPLITTKHYSHNYTYPSIISESNYNPMMYSQLWGAKGATVMGYFTAHIEGNKYNTWRADITANWDGQSKQTKLDQFGKLANIANIGNKKLVNYILCLNQDTNHISHENVRNYPYFTIKKNVPTIFGGDGGYIVLKGSIIRHHQYNAPFPQNGKIYVHNDTTKTSIYTNEGYLWSRLKWGSYYWRCEGGYADTGEWVKTPSDFKLYYGDPTRETRVKDWIDKDVPFYNNCGALWGVDENGYYVPTPPDGNLNGEVEWTIYANKDTKGKWARNNKRDKKNSYKGYPPKVILFKGLSIKVGYSDDAMNDEAFDSDTFYTCINSTFDNINEMKDVKFKVCTFDNKTPSYSTVDYLDNYGKSQYLDKTYNLATGQNLRQEHHLVHKIVSQYQDPKVIFTCNLHNDLNIKPYCLLTDTTLNNRKFIVETSAKNYRHNLNELEIKEKCSTYNEID